MGMNKPITVPGTLGRVLPWLSRRALVTHLDLRGVIGEALSPGRSLSHARLADAIEAAFKPKRLAAVALTVNSPGGSPVQSRLIYQAIRREADKKKTPVYAFIEDVGASGGYMLALAADEIYADASSVVGSIGVIAAGFGFQEAIARLGVERRVHTAGASKSQLDPFRREDPQDVERLQAVLDELHGHFIALVKERRGARLGAGDDIFSGAFWTAAPAAARGLVDGTAHLTDFLRSKFGDDVRIRKVSPGGGSLLRRLFGGTEQTAGRAEAIGAALPEAAWSTLEARALWARYGL
jgi:serine protease SohB